MTFNPDIKVVIGVNNAVTWVKEDPPHTVTRVDRLFDVIQPMQKTRHVLHFPGTYRYTCSLHS
ncbi:MAG: hypothetical protein RMI43_05610 [Candidatus Caldarchaeum sp.]|nr:hypothetical protein [Candidatus Caldarchaeum sp.]